MHVAGCQKRLPLLCASFLGWPTQCQSITLRILRHIATEVALGRLIANKFIQRHSAGVSELMANDRCSDDYTGWQVWRFLHNDRLQGIVWTSDNSVGGNSRIPVIDV